MNLKLPSNILPITQPCIIIVCFFTFFLPHLLQNIAFAAEVALVWDANTETNLAGYKLYYESETDIESFQGTNANEGDSPVIIFCDELTDPSFPSFSVSGLADGQVYYFALTAFDINGMESDLSDVVGAMAEENDNLSLYKSLTGDAEGPDSGGSACFLLNILGK